MEAYSGFEQGPIRPPSEAYSLLIRVTRNCPWNRCTFCPVYKGTPFSLRPVDHVKRDIDAVHTYVEALQRAADEQGRIHRSEMMRVIETSDLQDVTAFNAAFYWLSTGMRSVFLQDANSLVIKTADLVEILTHLKTRFPWVERVTSYARSHTLARMKPDDVQALAKAGLTRIHTGLESGSDQVLEQARKGATKEMHIRAGLNVKQAGIELSEYYMPGLGGTESYQEHALETADAMNQIDPDFIRLRTLAIPQNTPLFEEHQAGRFELCTDRVVAQEILLFLQALEGITSTIKSDHILNLFGDLEGTLPDDKERMIKILQTFLEMDLEQQTLYRVGRRTGIFSHLGELEDAHRRAEAEKACRQLGLTRENADEIIAQLMTRFI